MIWVVNGGRLLLDLPRFLERIGSLRPVLTAGMFITHIPEKLFPRKWSASSVPVVFDFQQAGSDVDEAKFLWCILPVRVYGYGVVMKIHRAEFVRWIRELEQPVPTQLIAEHVAKWLELQARQQAQAAAYVRIPWLRRGRRRRF
jgi:hypothetical protein